MAWPISPVVAPGLTAAVVTPGLTKGTSRSSTSAASRPARRMPSKSPASCRVTAKCAFRAASKISDWDWMVIGANIRASNAKTKREPMSSFWDGKRGTAVLVIGDEILSGRSQDTNSNHIARILGGLGIDLREVRVVGD